jgi:acyl-CoA thioester hydrolase
LPTPPLGYRVPVRWRDCDAFGHVHHSSFLVYLEEGRSEHLRQMLSADDPSYVIARIELDFRREIARHTRHVLVDCAIRDVGRTSLQLSERILHTDGAVVATCETTVVWWDPDQRRPRAFSLEERQRLAPA